MRDMRDLVRRLAGEGITVLLSSHLLAEVEELCNRVAIIRKGRIVYEGSLGALLATAGSGYLLRTDDGARAAAICREQPGIDARADGDGLRLTGGEDAVAALTVTLGRAGIGVTALVPQTASLEELFLDMTEGAAPDPEPAPEPAAEAVA
jgi:ABC-2 type transport system ATP-binding protein